MFPRDLGSNRLRSGFRGRTIQRSASHPGTPSDSEDDDSPSPIRIHDETEDEETDGGMTLNVQGHGDDTAPIVISDDEDTEQAVAASVHESELEEGEEREDTTNAQDKEMLDMPQEKHGEDTPEVSFVIDSKPSTSQTSLRDLSPVQLEQQIKYAFWQYPRDEIDLSRLARCLHCQTDGHIDEVCPSKRCLHCGAYAEHNSILCPIVKKCQRCREPGHSNCQGMKNTTVPCDICTLSGHAEDSCPIKYYTRYTLPATETLELWITCCACASKSHLVGDCPEVLPSKAPRWSLRSLDPAKVINLSIQSGIEQREREAENRNMRPEGIKIRGRANRHNADVNRRDPSDSDDLENFFSRPPPRDARRAPLPRGQHVDQYRPDTRPRYDRYDGYNGPSDTYRPPRTGYYATDSFGRPRSRSPPRFNQRRYGRPGSLSPSSLDDSYRPDTDDEPSGYRSPPPLRDNPFRRGKQDPPQNSHARGPSPLPSRGISIQLPTRKGSNPSLQNGGAPASLPSRPPAPGQPGAAKNSNKSSSNVAHMGAYQVQHNGLTKSQRKKNRQQKKAGKGA